MIASLLNGNRLEYTAKFKPLYLSLLYEMKYMVMYQCKFSYQNEFQIVKLNNHLSPLVPSCNALLYIYVQGLDFSSVQLIAYFVLARTTTKAGIQFKIKNHNISIFQAAFFNTLSMY